jgi:4-carboxymuconolactone decarboxylase
MYAGQPDGEHRRKAARTVTRLPSLGPDQLSPAQAELYSQIVSGRRAIGPQHFALVAEDGALNGPFNALLFSPLLGSAVQELGEAIRFSTDLTARTREIAILIVAAHWQSSFERGAHETVGRAAGLTEEELTALRAGRIPKLSDAFEWAAAQFVFASANGDVTDREWEQWSPVLGNSVAVELSALVGYYSMLALQLRIFRVEPRDTWS